MLTHQEQEKIIGALLKRKENSLCADCNSKMPCWASLDFGVFVCMNCSGAHRALGPSITRVKSTRLDSWNRDWLQNMQIGNSILNVYWQHELMQDEQNPKKPTTSTPIEAIIKYVQDKYVRKLYANPQQPMDPLRKYKSGLHLPTQTGSNQDQPSYSGGRTKAATENGMRSGTGQSIKQEASSKQTIKQEIRPKLPDFSVFDTVLKTNKPKPQQTSNLISFQDQKPTTTATKPTTTAPYGKNSSFDDFQFTGPKPLPQQHDKYNRQQFLSMGGISNSITKKQVNFEGFRKINQKTNSKAENLISFEGLTDSKNGQVSANIGYSQSLPYDNQYQKHGPSNTNGNNTYATVSGTYATVGAIHPFLKVNMQATHYQQFSQTNHKTVPKQFAPFDKSSDLGIQINWGTVKTEKIGQTISLQSNMNFNKGGEKMKPVETQNSWTDQWK